MCLSVVEICFAQRHVIFSGLVLSMLLTYPRITFVATTPPFSAKQATRLRPPAREVAPQGRGRALPPRAGAGGGCQCRSRHLLPPRGIALLTTRESRGAVPAVGLVVVQLPEGPRLAPVLSFMGTAFPDPPPSTKVWIPLFSVIWLGFGEEFLSSFLYLHLEESDEVRIRVWTILSQGIFCLKDWTFFEWRIVAI